MANIPASLMSRTTMKHQAITMKKAATGHRKVTIAKRPDTDKDDDIDYNSNDF